MALKTFNLNEEIYREYSEHSKKHGFSMSKKIENFIRQELEILKGTGKEEKTIKKSENAISENSKEHFMGKYC